MKNKPYVVAGFLAGMLVMLLFQQYLSINSTSQSSGFFTGETNTKDDIEQEVINSQQVRQKVHPVAIPKQLRFCGEPVPLSEPDVRQRLDRELLVNTYWHSNTIQLLKLASKYFPRIEEILKTYDVPEDFKYLVLAESGLRNVISPSNAVGYWQFLKPTAKEYGLEITGKVDERYHLERSTVASCQYLKEAKQKLGSWTLAAASYNLGMPSLKNEMKQQQANSYYDLYLNPETSRYLFRILAFKEVFQNPQQYGFYLEKDDFYKPDTFKTVSVDSSIHNLAEFAKQQNTTYKQLKLLNPWLRGRSLPNNQQKPYVIKLPI